jgi:D-alanyl-D-alanine carboxypeptidase (penicillin-binding protein 5/6)
MDKFVHPKGRYTEITNTNKLVRFYEGCDGGKTGFTNEAGFCLAATAKRDNMRIISVVIGEESSDNRCQDVRKMFDYAFANFMAEPLVKEAEVLSEGISIRGGKEKTVAVYPKRSAYAFVKRGEKSDVSYTVTCKQVKAPIEEKECVGELILYKNGVEIDRIELLAASKVEKANLFDSFREIARNWNG